MFPTVGILQVESTLGNLSLTLTEGVSNTSSTMDEIQPQLIDTRGDGRSHRFRSLLAGRGRVCTELTSLAIFRSMKQAQ